MEFLFVGLVLALVPLVLPIAAWVSAVRTRGRVRKLEATVDAQQATIDLLANRIKALQREIVAAPKPSAVAVPQPPAPARGRCPSRCHPVAVASPRAWR